MHRKVEYNVVCDCCGKSFVAHDKRKIYCSRKCTDVAIRRRKGQDSRLEPRRIKCVVCGKEFETFNATQKTCSSECSKELKLSIVKSYLNKDGSYEILAKEANVHFTTVRKWIKKYVAFGESAFDSTNTNASYTKEFKEHVVLDYLNGAGAYIDLAVKYKIPSNSTIEKWVKDYNSYIELKDYIPGGKEIYMTKSRKVSKEEKLSVSDGEETSLSAAIVVTF